MNNHVKNYLDLLRPFTLLAPLIVSSCVMVASLMYNKETDGSLTTTFITIITASFSLALLNGASNALNQATDIAEDGISKPYRPIPRGVITPKQAQTVAYLLYLSSLLLSLTIHIIFSAFIVLITVFTITYSLPPRMKQFLFVNQLWVAIPRGLLGILASWSVFGNPLQTVPLTIGCIAALFLFGGTVTKDILDAEADKKSGIKTLVNVLGIQKTALISLAFMCLSFVLIIPLILVGFLGFYLFPLAFLVILTFCIWWLMVRNHNQSSERYENTSAWALMYATYFIFALGFAGLTISFV